MRSPRPGPTDCRRLACSGDRPASLRQAWAATPSLGPRLSTSHAQDPTSGRPAHRPIDAAQGRSAKVTGQALYVTDISPAGVLYGVTVRRTVAPDGSARSASTRRSPGTSSPSSRPPTSPARNVVALIDKRSAIPCRRRGQSRRGADPAAGASGSRRCSRKRGAGSRSTSIRCRPSIRSRTRCPAGDRSGAPTTSSRLSRHAGDVGRRVRGRARLSSRASTRPGPRNSCTSNPTGCSRLPSPRTG